MFLDRSLEGRYLNWLYSVVGGKYGPCGEYKNLMHIFLGVDFSWFVSNDDNRAQDGIELRRQFYNEIGELYSEIPVDSCTVLEMMIALAHRIETDIVYDPENGDSTGYWFREMIDNLGLKQCTDALWSPDKHVFAVNCIYNMIERTYDYSGLGGLFPLKQPMEDQRNIEIWSQMASYLYENSYQKTYQN